MMRNVDLQITTEGDARRLPPGEPGTAGPHEQVLPPRLHAAAAVRLPGREGEPRLVLPRQDQGEPTARPATEGADPQPDDLQASLVRVETEQVITGLSQSVMTRLLCRTGCGAGRPIHPTFIGLPASSSGWKYPL